MAERYKTSLLKPLPEKFQSKGQLTTHTTLKKRKTCKEVKSMPRTLINTTDKPVNITQDNRVVVVGPGNRLTVQDDGIAAAMLANASIAGFRFADSRDGLDKPTT